MLKIESTAFAESGEIPSRFTCEGEDIAPPLTWSGVRKGDPLEHPLCSVG